MSITCINKQFDRSNYPTVELRAVYTIDSPKHTTDTIVAAYVDKLHKADNKLKVRSGKIARGLDSITGQLEKLVMGLTDAKCLGGFIIRGEPTKDRAALLAEEKSGALNENLRLQIHKEDSLYNAELSAKGSDRFTKQVCELFEKIQ